MDLKRHVARIIPRVFLAALIWFIWGSYALLRAQTTALDLDDKTVDVLQASKGKLAVLIFVRTDCPISNRYAPTIQRLSEIYRNTAAFWLVYPSRKESAGAIREHDQEFGYKIPAVRDPHHTLVKLSGAQITPEAAVFTGQGRLVYHGRIDNLYQDLGRARLAPTTHELDDAIQAALRGKISPLRSVPAVGCYISDLQ